MLLQKKVPPKSGCFSVTLDEINCVSFANQSQQTLCSGHLKICPSLEKKPVIKIIILF